MTVALFHPGTQHSRQTAVALQELGQLAFFATGIFGTVGSGSGPLARRLAEASQGFGDDRLDPGLVRTFPQYELPERVLARLGAARAAAAFDRFANDRMGRSVAAMARSAGARVLWGYDNSSLTAFTHPAARGMTRVLDRTIGDWREWNRQVDRIEDTHADWLPSEFGRASAALVERSEAEYAAATRILCPSPFVRDTILRHSCVEGLQSKLALLPYAYDDRHFAPPAEIHERAPSEPLRVLFAGQVSARKGVQHVLEAFDRMPSGSVKLTCAGPLAVPEAVLAPWRDRVDFRSKVSRIELARLMQAHEVLVLPSYFEGSAIVLLEALASGLAVIATPQAGLGPSAASAITLAEPDSLVLAQALEDLAQDRARLVTMRRAAPGDAAPHSLAAYRARIAEFLASLEG